MQSITKEPDKPDGSTLKEMCLIVQAADAEADMGQYALETGNIVLSMPEEVSMEAMRCTGTIIPDKKAGTCRALPAGVCCRSAKTVR